MQWLWKGTALPVHGQMHACMQGVIQRTDPVAMSSTLWAVNCFTLPPLALQQVQNRLLTLPNRMTLLRCACCPKLSARQRQQQAA